MKRPKQRPAPSWKTRLARARRAGTFTRMDKTLVYSFLTCGIDERARQLGEERLAPGQSVCVLSEEALSLGYAFYYAVDRDDVAEAEKVYQQIQELPTIYSGKEGQWL